MAGKEATVYIIDVGNSMGEKANGREETNLEWAMEYVWDKITTTVSKNLLALSVSLRRCLANLLRKGLDKPQDCLDERDRVAHRW